MHNVHHQASAVCTWLLQDMKEKHEKETSLKAERDSMAKDAADREAADQVHSCHMHHLWHVLMWHYRTDTPALSAW